MMNLNFKRNRIAIGWLFLTLLFLVPSVATAADISISGPSGPVPENGSLIFTVSTDTIDPVNPIVVAFNVFGDVDGADFTLLTPSPVTILPNTASVNIIIDITPDNRVEIDEMLFVNIPPFGPHTTSGLGSVVITNDDTASVRIDDATAVDESSGPSSFLVTLENEVDAAAAVTVNYATGDGSATTADNDYMTANSSLSVSGAANSTQTIDVTINPDTKVEVDEDFTVTLSGGPEVTFSNATATGTITNDDTGATVSVADAANRRRARQ